MSQPGEPCNSHRVVEISNLVTTSKSKFFGLQNGEHSVHGDITGEKGHGVVRKGDSTSHERAELPGPEQGVETDQEAHTKLEPGAS